MLKHPIQGSQELLSSILGRGRPKCSEETEYVGNSHVFNGMNSRVSGLVVLPNERNFWKQTSILRGQEAASL